MMLNTKFLSLVFLFVITPNTKLYVSSECVAGKYFVHVADKLPNDSKPLAVRCQSKDTDLGNKTLNPNQEFQWSFCSNGFSTLFFCHFWWNGKESVFDVYTQNLAADCNNKILGQGANTCYWEARQDGFYLAVWDGSFSKRHDWNPKIKYMHLS